MPIYTWKCGKCNSEAEVLRSFKDYQVAPSTDLDSEKDLETVAKDCEHTWIKVIHVPIAVNKWPNSTGPVKGRP